MGADAVRLMFADPLLAGFERSVVAALSAEKWEKTSDLAAPLVIFIESDIASILDSVRQEALAGRDRVLVVAVGESGLPPLFYFRLLEAGAADVLTWSDQSSCIQTLIGRLRRWSAIAQIVDSESVRTTLVGCSGVWKRVVRRVVEAAAFGDSPLLITGETGTGKELVARLVHEVDRRNKKGDFVVLDCSTVSKELSGSEFFGHEKGAFTSAVSARNGAFALANGGTLFLDELGELPLPLQAELLRVVQEKTYKRVGGNVWQTTEFRLVSATNRTLEQEQREGRFRGDLLYRIAGWTVRLPPLRERREDILPLASHFLTQRLGYTPALDPLVESFLVAREYPGNIRELRQVVTRMAQRHVGSGPITIGDLGDDLVFDHATLPHVEEQWCGHAFEDSIERAVELGVGLKEIGRIAEDVAVKLAVQREHGSLQAAAKRLGVTDRALQLRRAQQRTSEIVPAADANSNERAS